MKKTIFTGRSNWSLACLGICIGIVIAGTANAQDFFKNPSANCKYCGGTGLRTISYPSAMPGGREIRQTTSCPACKGGKGVVDNKKTSGESSSKGKNFINNSGKYDICSDCYGKLPSTKAKCRKCGGKGVVPK